MWEKRCLAISCLESLPSRRERFSDAHHHRVRPACCGCGSLRSTTTVCGIGVMKASGGGKKAVWPLVGEGGSVAERSADGGWTATMRVRSLVGSATAWPLRMASMRSDASATWIQRMRWAVGVWGGSAAVPTTTDD